MNPDLLFKFLWCDSLFLFFDKEEQLEECCCMEQFVFCFEKHECNFLIVICHHLWFRFLRNLHQKMDTFDCFKGLLQPN